MFAYGRNDGIKQRKWKQEAFLSLVRNSDESMDLEEVVDSSKRNSSCKSSRERKDRGKAKVSAAAVDAFSYLPIIKRQRNNVFYLKHIMFQADSNKMQIVRIDNLIMACRCDV